MGSEFYFFIAYVCGDFCILDLVDVFLGLYAVSNLPERIRGRGMGEKLAVA